MSTSWGRYFSKASFSGALTDVWPATIAPTLVAANIFPRYQLWGGKGGAIVLTRAVLGNDTVDVLGFDGVHYKV